MKLDWNEKVETRKQKRTTMFFKDAKNHKTEESFMFHHQQTLKKTTSVDRNHGPQGRQPRSGTHEHVIIDEKVSAFPEESMVEEKIYLSNIYIYINHH